VEMHAIVIRPARAVESLLNMAGSVNSLILEGKRTIVAIADATLDRIAPHDIDVFSRKLGARWLGIGSEMKVRSESD